MLSSNSKVTEAVKILLSIKEAAAALAISERKLWDMTTNHEIPHVRLGRCLRYPLSDLMLWIEERKEGGKAR